MGLIRKTLAAGTLGVVKGSSKKQRVAKSIEKAAWTNAGNSTTLIRQQQAMRNGGADVSNAGTQRAEQFARIEDLLASGALTRIEAEAAKRHVLAGGTFEPPAPPQYKPGDVVNGHVLTAELVWVPIA